MELALKSKEGTQHKLEFEINGRSLSLTLTKNSSWNLVFNDGTKFTVEELIRICKFIYDRKIIDKDDVIVIYDTDDNAIYIRDSEQVENAILSWFVIRLFGKESQDK